MKASDFMLKIDRGEIEFKSNFASGTFGWEFDFAEAYSKHQNQKLIEALKEVEKELDNIYNGTHTEPSDDIMNKLYSLLNEIENGKI